MQTNLLWKGLDFCSLEHCLVKSSSDGTKISSTLVGFVDKKIYTLEYYIEANCNWETLLFEIKSRCNNDTQLIRVEGDGKGNWTVGGQEAAELGGCIDIDISLTPFTNSLPIKRLNLASGQANEIGVVYIDVLEHKVLPLRQKYTCLSSLQYVYENVPDDFKAKISVDECGFVIDYPPLFTREAFERYENA